MTVLSAKDVRNIEGSFYDILVHAPGRKVEKQRFFKDTFRISVTRQNYEEMWDRLKDRLGRAAAGEAVFDYVLFSATPRLKTLLSTALDDESVDLRENEPAIVWDLFHGNGNPRRIGEHLINYMNETNHQWSSGPTEKRIVVNSESDFEYDVALSFAGEQRVYVEGVAQHLRAAEIRVFYDDFEEVDLWGKDLAAHLDTVYRKKARYCIIFLSKEYAEKAWPRHEAKSALARAVQEKGEYILPVRFDDVDLPGLQPTIKFINARWKNPKALAKLTIKKLEK